MIVIPRVGDLITPGPGPKPNGAKVVGIVISVEDPAGDSIIECTTWTKILWADGRTSWEDIEASNRLFRVEPLVQHEEDEL